MHLRNLFGLSSPDVLAAASRAWLPRCRSADFPFKSNREERSFVRNYGLVEQPYLGLIRKPLQNVALRKGSPRTMLDQMV